MRTILSRIGAWFASWWKLIVALAVVLGVIGGCIANDIHARQQLPRVAPSALNFDFPATYTPGPTATLTPSPTATPTRTPIPTPTLTPTVTSTPDGIGWPVELGFGGGMGSEYWTEIWRQLPFEPGNQIVLRDGQNRFLKLTLGLPGDDGWGNDRKLFLTGNMPVHVTGSGFYRPEEWQTVQYPEQPEGKWKYTALVGYTSTFRLGFIVFMQRVLSEELNSYVSKFYFQYDPRVWQYISCTRAESIGG